MPRIVPLLLCLVTLTGLSGCADGPDPDATEPAADPATAEPGQEADTVAAAEGGVPATPAALGLAVARCDATVNAGAGAAGNLQSAYLACPFAKAEGSLSDYAWALVEADRAGPLPTATRFYLYLLSESCDFSSTTPCWHAVERSDAPRVRLVVDARLLGEVVADGPRAWTGMDGLAAQQEVALAVTLVPPGVDLPAGYSAFP